MVQVILDDVSKLFGAYKALTDISVRIAERQFVALIGPSGCGKSTLLRTIAGLDDISAGRIHIGDTIVNDLPPRLRDVAMVFQSYALYPHMNVEANLTYALRVQGSPKSERRRAAEDVAKVLGLEQLLDRYPRELSGGQRQRVAMGRAIIRQPKVFLFDEPLSNLDAELRVRMRGEIRALHDRLQATSIYVTHDQVEAMTMADHIVVLKAGRVEQQGPPLDLYDRPANRFVAGFIGSPSMNFLPGFISEDGQSVGLAGIEVQFPLAGRAEPGLKVDVGIRPEHLLITDGTGPNELPIQMSLLEATGAQMIVHGRTARGDIVTVVVNRRMPLFPGERFGLKVCAPDTTPGAPLALHVFDSKDGRAVAR